MFTFLLGLGMTKMITNQKRGGISSDFVEWIPVLIVKMAQNLSYIQWKDWIFEIVSYKNEEYAVMTQ